MKLLSWNVAGIRAVLRKNELDFVLKGEYDILAFSETKAEQKQVKNIEKFKELYPHQSWNSSKTKKGYSGTAIWSKIPFVKVFDPPEFDIEGRVCAVEFKFFYLVNVYTPNSKQDLSRLKERTQEWDPLFKEYCNELKSMKPVIICGDLNVMHKPNDLHNPERHRNNDLAGYTIQGRKTFTELLDSGYDDSFRLFNKESGYFSWWSYFRGSRENNVGFRLDYFLTDKRLADKVMDSTIERYQLGSDHCPITLQVNL